MEKVLEEDLLNKLRIRYQLLAEAQENVRVKAQALEKARNECAAVDDSIVFLVWSELGLDARTQQFQLDLGRGILTQQSSE